MNYKDFIATTISSILILTSCSEKVIKFEKEHLELLNNVKISIDENSENTLKLDAKPEGGIAVLKNIDFDSGTIDLELKGENNPGRSFVGFAFNVQNDSTYEAIYFRPFNFQSEEQIKREHSVQYISPPKHEWKFLRTNFGGQYEAEFPRKPAPDDWFGVRIKIDVDRVYVHDTESQTELLNIERLEKQISDKIGLWAGNNSKGEFKNLKIR